VVLRRRGGLSPRGLLLSLMVASALLQSGAALSRAFAILLACRFTDGVTHVGVVMLLMGIGAGGGRLDRWWRMMCLGALLVLGVGAGVGIGGAVAHHGARLPLAAGALLTLAALAFAAGDLARLAPEASRAAPGPWRQVARDALLPSVLVLCERLSLGILTVALPFALSAAQGPKVVGRVLGIFFTASVLVMPAAQRLGRAVGVRTVALAGAALLAGSLGLCAATPLFAGPLSGFWAMAGGSGAGALFLSSLLLVAEVPGTDHRVRVMGMVHASGGLGFLLGTSLGGVILAMLAPRGEGAATVIALGGGLVALAAIVTALTRPMSWTIPSPEVTPAAIQR
jgi:hypothetical protein